MMVCAAADVMFVVNPPITALQNVIRTVGSGSILKRNKYNTYHTIIRAAFVCVFVPLRSFDGSLPNLVAVCRWTSHLPLRGSFSKRSTGRRVNGSLSLSTILYMRQPHATQLQKAPFALLQLHLRV